MTLELSPTSHPSDLLVPTGAAPGAAPGTARHILIPDEEDGRRAARARLDPETERLVMERIVAAVNQAFGGASPRYGVEEDAWRVYALIERCLHEVVRDRSSHPAFRPPEAPEAVAERILASMLGLDALEP